MKNETDCELIEEFYISHGGKPHMKEDLWFYESDWNMLMTVIEKIDSLMPPIKIPTDLPKLKNGTHGSEPFIEVTALPISCGISEAFDKIVEFIKWYNRYDKYKGTFKS